MISEHVTLPLGLIFHGLPPEPCQLNVGEHYYLNTCGSNHQRIFQEHIAPFAPGDPIRAIERASIRAYMELHRDKLKGRVLDFGCGKQPYRDLVDGEYIPFDWPQSLRDLPYDCDAIMCNQVLQYIHDPTDLLIDGPLKKCLKLGGYLVITYPTNWDEVETTDFWRFTKAGMENIVRYYTNYTTLTILDHTRRAEVRIGNFTFPLGYGLVAQKV